jgi:hypothetical protein
MDAAKPESANPTRMRGDGQVALLAAYGLLAFAATGRSVYELSVKFNEAPLEYSLSTLAAVIYLVAVWAIARGDRLALRVARAACTFELAGVLIVGTVSVFDSEAFSRSTVWAKYGMDYGWLPLFVPMLALWWIHRQSPRG